MAKLKPETIETETTTAHADAPNTAPLDIPEGEMTWEQYCAHALRRRAIILGEPIDGTGNESTGN